MRTMVGALVMSAALASACGKSKPNLYDQLLKENDAALKARLASLTTILAEAKKRPALSKPALTGPGGDGQFIGLEETTQLQEHGYQGGFGCHPNYDGQVFSLMAGKGVRQEDPSAIEKMIRDDFKAILEPPYAMVCITLEAVPPAKGADDTFSGGTFKGECRFYEIASAKYLGGVGVSTQLTSALVNSYNGSGLEESMEKQVTEDYATEMAPVKPPTMFCSWSK